MSDLSLENQNTAERQTELIATNADLGPNELKRFPNGVILQVKPGAHTAGTFDGINGVAGGSGRGIVGEGATGVHGEGKGDSGIGVSGNSTGIGVLGEGAIGIQGKSKSNGVGVQGDSAGTGVHGVGSTGISGEGGGAGVIGLSTGGGSFGVGVQGFTKDGKGIGVHGITESGIGVLAAATTGTGLDASSNTGTAVNAHSGSGRGGVFTSTSAAQIQLLPHGPFELISDAPFSVLALNPKGSETAGKMLPAKGQLGDLLCTSMQRTDKEGKPIEVIGVLWFCVGIDETGSAQWRQVLLGPEFTGAG